MDLTWMAKLPTWLTVVITGSGWLTASMMGILDLPAKINSFEVEGPKAAEALGNKMFLNKALSGTWSTENVSIDDYGDQPEPGEGGPLWITMRVYKGEAVGEVVSNGLKTSWMNSRVMFKGRERSGSVEGMVYDLRDKKPLPLAWVTVSPDPAQKGLLRIQVTKQGPIQFIPKEAILYPASDGDMPEGELNTDFLMRVEKAAKRPEVVPAR